MTGKVSRSDITVREGVEQYGILSTNEPVIIPRKWFATFEGLSPEGAVVKLQAVKGTTYLEALSKIENKLNELGWEVV